MGRRDVAPWWQRLWTERLAILLAVAVLHAPAIAWLMAPPKQPKQRPPAVGRSKPMQLVWIPREQPQVPDRPEPPATPTADTATALAVPGTLLSSPPRQKYSDAPTAERDLAADVVPPAWDARRDLLGIRALVRTFPAQDTAQASQAGPGFSGGREAIRLPDDGPPKVEGIVVRAEVSLDDRVQGVLALVGLGRVDPCPDIRSQLRSAIATGDPQEVQHWIDRERYCR